MSQHAIRHTSRAEPYTATVSSPSGEENAQVTIDDAATLSVEARGGDAGVVRDGDRAWAYRAVRTAAGAQVWIGGRTYSFETVASTGRTSRSAPSPGVLLDLTAPMPGTILELKVAPGDAFAAHDPLIVMESMKMEMTLSAHAAGRVQAIHCCVGELVEMGALLIAFDKEGGDADLA